MKQDNIRKDNHFVPCLYLKGWESSPNQIWRYRTLVQHNNIDHWKESYFKGIAFHTHLYTRVISGKENDDMEKWFDNEFESPAKESINKIISDSQLTRSDWKNIIRFVAAQDVRTPTRFIEGLGRWKKMFPEILESTIQKAVERLESGLLHNSSSPASKYLPLNIRTNSIPNSTMATIEAETIIGRATWLFSIHHLLTNTINVLHEHKWTIMRPPIGMKWFTSDSPVIKLNYYGTNNYDFKGGWGSPGTEIFFPISPDHILYTQIGCKPPRRGTRFSKQEAQLVHRFFAESAHRAIFFNRPSEYISSLRSRIIDNDAVKNEKKQWEKWRGFNFEVHMV